MLAYVELLNFLYVGWAMHLQYDSAFVGVSFNPLVGDHKTKELVAAYSESTYFRVKAHSYFRSSPKTSSLSATCWDML